MNTKLIEKMREKVKKIIREQLGENTKSKEPEPWSVGKIMDLFFSYKSQIIKEVIESLPKKKETRNREDIYAICNTCGKSAENMAGFPECSCMGFNEAIDQIKNKLELLVKK
jgi:hypothetical protein